MKTKLMVCVLCSMVLAVLCAEGRHPAAAEDTATVGHPAGAGTPAAAGAFLPQPFTIHYERYDYHVMLTFEGHPE